MDRTVRALVAVVEGVDVLEVERALPDDPSFQLVGIANGVDEAVRRIHNVDYDVLLVACSGTGERAVQLIDAATRASSNAAVVVLSTQSPNGFLRRAFEAGAADVVLFDQPREQLRFALHKALARRSGLDTGGAGPGHHPGEVVTVLGPKGGTGKTLVAVNVAVALAQMGQRVTIVDVDLQFGDVALTMGLAPETTIYDLALAGGSLDEDALEHYLVRHPSGVRALLAPSRPDQASAVTSDLLREVYAVLRASNDVVIVDTPPGFTAEVILSIDGSTSLVMVGMLDALSLKNTKLGLETLALMGFDQSAARLVLNRAHSRVGISVSDVISVLGREPDVYVPSDREIPRAVNEGVPIVIEKPESEAAAAFRSLAYQIAGASAPTPQPAAQRRRLFGRRS